MSEKLRSTQDVEERQQYMLFNVIRLPEGPFVNTSNINENSMLNRSANSHNESCLSVNEQHYARHNESVNCPTNTTGQITSSNERSNAYDANKYYTTTIASAPSQYNYNNTHQHISNNNCNNINSQQYCVNAIKYSQGKREFDSANVIHMQHPSQQLPRSSPSQQQQQHEHEVYVQNTTQPNLQCQHTVTHANKNCVKYVMETSTTPCNYNSPAITPTTAVTTSSPAVRDVLYTQSCAAPLMLKRETNGSMIGPFMNSFQPPVALFTNAISSSSSPSYNSPITSQKKEQITPSSYLSPGTNTSLQWPNSGQTDAKKQENQIQREGSTDNMNTIMNTNNSNNDESVAKVNCDDINNNSNSKKSNSAMKVLQMANIPELTMMQENNDEPLYEVLPYSCDILLEHNINSLDQVQCILLGKKRSAQNMMLARNKKTNEIIWWCRNTSRCKVRACEQQKSSPNSNQSGKVMVEVVRCDQPHQMRFIANQLHSPSHLSTFHRYATQTSEVNTTHVRSRNEQTHCCDDGLSGTNLMENNKITSYHLEPVTPPAENALDKSRTRYDGYYLTPYTNVKLVASMNVAPNTLLYQQIQQQQSEHQNQQQQQQRQQQEIDWNANSYDLHQEGVKLSNTIAVISPPQQPTPVMLTSQKYQHEPYRQVMMLPNNSRHHSQLTDLQESIQRYGQNNMMCNKESVCNEMNYVQHSNQHHHIQQEQQQERQFERQKRNVRTTPTPVQVIRGNVLPLYIPFGAEMRLECMQRYNLHSQQQLHEHQLSELPPQQYQQLNQSTSVAQAPYTPQMQCNPRQEIAL